MKTIYMKLKIYLLYAARPKCFIYFTFLATQKIFI